ncbi:MAG: hypothetical protein ACLQQ4_01950 [Bacteroidia bacterium]
MKNHIKEPFIVVLLAAAMLTLLSFVPTSFTIMGITLKPITMFTDVTPAEEVRPEIRIPMPSMRTWPVDFKDTDSLHFKKGYWPIEEYAITPQDNLAVFYNALSESKKKKVHLAYFGDSMIEGDIVTQDLRAMLQKKFGGRGVGFVPIINFVPGFRQTIHQSFTPNWTSYKVIFNSPAIPYGLNGEVFVPNITNDLEAASWALFQGVKQYAGLDSFHVVKLYYSNPNNAIAKVFVNKDNTTTALTLDNGGGLKVLTLNSGKAIHTIQMTFTANSNIYIYGAGFEDTTGVYVDDLDMRGSSGQQLSVLDGSIVQQFEDDMNIKCVVLQYGINVVHSGTTQYDYYTIGFSNTINSLKKKLPGCAILVNSVSDRAVHRQGGYQTMPEIHDFVGAQRTIAKQTNTAFWNLFEAMGADSSMINMVNSKLPLANLDYTHMKPLGGSYLAGYFYCSLLYDYEKYVWENIRRNEHS